MDHNAKKGSKSIYEVHSTNALVPSRCGNVPTVHQTSNALNKSGSTHKRMVCCSLSSIDSSVNCIVTKTQKQTRRCYSFDPKVRLLRLPSWISELGTVHVSQECVVPTTEKSLDYNSLSALTKISNKRLTRSVGETLDVSCSTKLPAQRPQKPKFVNHEYGPFLGFNPEEDYFLSNNHSYQFLSGLMERVDEVCELAVADTSHNIHNVGRQNPFLKPIKKEPLDSGSECGSPQKVYSHCNAIGSLKPQTLSKKKSRANRSRNMKLLSGTHRTQKDVQNTCGKDFCRLGCVCRSLKGGRRPIITRCAHEECMFSLTGDGCLQGFNGTPNRFVKTLLSNQPSNSTDQTGIVTKRIRKPTKRWLVEEEESESQHLMRKKFKPDSCVPPKDTNVSPANKDPPETPNKFDFFGARLRCLEHDRLNCRCLFERNSSPEGLPPKHVSERDTPPPSPVAKEPVVSHDDHSPKSISSGHNHVQEKTANDEKSGSISNLSDSSLESVNFSTRSRHYDTIYRKYFTNRKNYCRVARSDCVPEEDLASMCISTLSPLKAKSMILMKWPDLENKIKERSAHLWISHIPKRVTKIYITEERVPPDNVSVVMDDVRNVLSKSSTTEYFFKFWRKYSVPSGCCILISHDIYWELYGNLELDTRNECKCLVKLQKFPKETSAKNLVVLKSIRKILVYEHGGVHLGGESKRVEGDEFSEQERLSIVDDSEFSEYQELKETDGFGTEDSVVSGGSHVNQVSRNNIIQEKPLPTIPFCHVPCWHRLHLGKVFDKLSVKNPCFIATYSQLTSAVRISKTNSVPVKIVFCRGISYKFEGKTWKQGIYADYTDSRNSVLIGPYYQYEKPGIKAFYDVNGIFFHTPVLVTKELMRRNIPNGLVKKPVNPEAGVMSNVVSSTNGNCVSDSANADLARNGVPKMRSILSSTTSPSLANPNFKIKIGNVKNVLSLEQEVINSTVDMPVNSAPSCADQNSASKTLNNAVNVNNEDPVVECVDADDAEQSLGIRIENVLGNFTEFDKLSCTQETGSQEQRDEGNAEFCEKSESNIVSGYLVADVPNLLPIAVLKGGEKPEEVRKITIRDSRWIECGFRRCFSSVDDARHYLQSIIRVKFYPETLRVCWAFVRVQGLHSIEKSAGIYHPAELTKDQFITPRGVFSYEAINVNQFQKYGLKTHDLHRLLEFKRRIVIREAKNELTSLFPDADVCTLLKAIELGLNAIKHLERTSKSLTKEMEGQIMKKKYFLCKIKKKHGAAAMAEVMKKLDALKRSSNSKSDGPRMTGGHHSKSPKKSSGTSTSMSSTLPSNHSHSENLDETHNPMRSPATDNSTTPIRDANQGNLLRLVPPVKLFESPPNPERTTNLSTPQTVNLPVNDDSNPEAASSLHSPTKRSNAENHRYSNYCTHGSPLRSVKKTVKLDTVKDGRTLFSGRLVSAATKKSLRKYNYIIPRNRSRYQDLKTPDGVTVLNDHNYTSISENAVIPLPAFVAPDLHPDEEFLIKQEHVTSELS